MSAQGNKHILMIAVLLIVAAGAGVFFFANKIEGAPGSEVAASATQETAGAEAGAEATAEAEEDGAEDASPAAAQTETPTETATAEAAPAAAATDAEDPIVARVAGEEIRKSAVTAFIDGLPEQMRQLPEDAIFPMALEQVVNTKIVEKKTSGLNLEADAEVQKRMKDAKDQIIRGVFVQRELDKAITPERIQKAYDDYVKAQPSTQETHARHILVDSEEKAKEIITKLDAGAKFEDLAKENGKDGTAAKGGDLGYFAKSDMVPEFAEAAFATEPGSYTKAPVKTQFGWHVIKVEDRRLRQPPTKDEMEPMLKTNLRQEVVESLLNDWRKEANVEILFKPQQPAPEPAPAAGGESAPAEAAPAPDKAAQ